MEIVYVPAELGAVQIRAVGELATLAEPVVLNKTVLAGSANATVLWEILVAAEPIVPAETVKATFVVTAA
jgi:hypothetical protein